MRKIIDLKIVQPHFDDTARAQKSGIAERRPRLCRRRYVDIARMDGHRIYGAQCWRNSHAHFEKLRFWTCRRLCDFKYQTLWR